VNGCLFCLQHQERKTHPEDGSNKFLRNFVGAMHNIQEDSRTRNVAQKRFY